MITPDNIELKTVNPSKKSYLGQPMRCTFNEDGSVQVPALSAFDIPEGFVVVSLLYTLAYPDGEPATVAPICERKRERRKQRA